MCALIYKNTLLSLKYGGYNREILVFDANYPSKVLETRFTSRTRKSKFGQRGLLSAISFAPDFSGMYAVGSYTGSVCLYEENTGNLLLDLDVIEKEQFNNSSQNNYSNSSSSMINIDQACRPRGGITQLKWTPNGKLLVAGKRKDNSINVYDIRGTGKGKILYSFNRQVNNNQRIYFDIDATGKYLCSGASDHSIYIYSLETGKLVSNINMATFGKSCIDNTVNGLSLSKAYSVSDIDKGFLGTALITTGSREKRYKNNNEVNDEHTSIAMQENYCLCKVSF